MLFRFALDVLTLLELLFVLVRLDEFRKLGDELFAAELDWFNSSEFAVRRSIRLDCVEEWREFEERRSK